MRPASADAPRADPWQDRAVHGANAALIRPSSAARKQADQILRDFGDKYPSRRKLESDLLKPLLSTMGG
jgi:hypothetical protein